MRKAGIAAVLGLVLVLAGCAGFRNERKGRDVGRAICNVKTADNANEAQRALNKLNRKLNDAQRITGNQVQSDVRQIQDNLNDLVQHADNPGDALKQQDIAKIQRNLSQVVQNTPGLVQRFYQGVQEGLGNCTS